MKVLIQRVTEATVTADKTVCGKIGKGYLIFLGVGCSDTEENADRLIDKIEKLRLFADENGKTNLSVTDVKGELLIVSQFTLYADCRKGTRPGFSYAAPPDIANRLYEYFLSTCRKKFTKVECGIFGADMQVSLINDGPFTVMLEN